MADNVAITPGSGDSVAADDIGGAKFQRVKLIHGADGTNDGDVSSANGLPVDATGSGDVPITLDSEAVVLGAGSAAIGKLAANSGVDIGDVDVASSALPTGAATSAKQGIAGTDLTGGAGAVAAGTQRVTLASDDPAVAKLGTIDTDTGNIAGDTSTIAGDTTSLDAKITTGDMDTGAGTDDKQVVGIVGSKSGGGELIPGSAADGLLVNLGSNNDISGTVDLGATDNAVLDDIAANQTDKSQHTKITDGTEEVNVNASNELQTRDDDANTLLGTIDSDTSDIATDTGTIASDTTTIAGDTTSIDGKITACNTGAVVLAAGSAAVGKLAANSGVDIGDVDVTSITNGSINGPGSPTIDSYTHAAINLAAGANQVLVASAASKQIWVYGIGFTVNVAGTVSFQDEDDTAITGVMPFATNSGMGISPSGNFAMPIWKLATDKDLEIDIVTSELDGWIDYAIVSV